MFEQIQDREDELPQSPSTDEYQSSSLWDDDSAIGDDVTDTSDAGSTQSLTSSVLNYAYENGRRYHGFRAGQYFMPNDEYEQEGMDLMHHISLMLLKGELYRAPIESPTEILEIGTGTGIWAIDVADKFPGAHVTATDLSPIQPGWVPPNLQFEIDDCESEWSFDRSFDFIHMRNLSGAIADWPGLLSACYKYLKPGGWVEVSNIEIYGQSQNGKLPADSAAIRWQTNLEQAANIFGRKLNIGPELETLITQAGFENVHDDQHKVPMSDWKAGETELSRHFQALVFMELEAMSLRLYTAVLQWPIDKLQALLQEVQEDIADPKYQMFSVMHYVCGRKPVS